MADIRDVNGIELFIEFVMWASDNRKNMFDQMKDDFGYGIRRWYIKNTVQSDVTFIEANIVHRANTCRTYH